MTTESAAPSGTKLLPSSVDFLNPIVVDDLIRIGHPHDCGYVLPASRLKGIDAMISMGISDNWTLEEDVARKHPDLPIHGYDHTISESRFRAWIPLEFAKFLLFQSDLAGLRRRWRTYFGYKRFFSGVRRHFQERIFSRPDNENDATIDKVFSRIGNAHHVFLKMDIEGTEYRVLPDAMKYADRIDLLVIEFHDTLPLREIFTRVMKELLEKFAVVHTHGNNWAGIADDGVPESLEITLVHRRFISDEPKLRDRLPLPGLDSAADTRRADYPLIFR